MIWLALALACGVFNGEPDATPPTDERKLLLVYTADVHGEIEPCG